MKNSLVIILFSIVMVPIETHIRRRVRNKVVAYIVTLLVALILLSAMMALADLF